MGAEWSEGGGRLARGKILADRQQLKRKKGSWVVLGDLYLPPYLCAGAVGMCGSGLLQSQSGKIPQVDKEYGQTTCYCRLNATCVRWYMGD